MDDAGSDAPSCVPMAEVCDGEDNDCDGRADQSFACVAGSEDVSCVTTCGSTGTGTCGTDCSFATCVPPDESCNYEDDDCDGVTDEGLTAFSPPTMFDPGMSTTVRAEATPDGFVVVVVSDGVYARLLSLDGAPTGPASLIDTDEMTFLDTATSEGRITIGWASSGGISATVLDSSDLSVIVPTRVIEGSAGVFPGHLAVEQSATQIVFAYIRDAAIRGIATDADLGSASPERLFAAQDGPGRKFDFLAPSNGSLDWVLVFPSGSVVADLYLQNVRPTTGRSGTERRVTNTGSTNELLPVLADDGNGVLALAWNAEGVLEVELRRQSDFVSITSNAGGALPPADFDVFRTIDIAYSNGRWIVVHASMGDVAARIFDADGRLIAGSDAAPLVFTPTSGANAVAGAALDGRVLAAAATGGLTEAAILGCVAP